MNATFGVINSVLKLFPDLTPFTSPLEYLSLQSYKLVNFILQSVFFSTSVISISSAILIALGLTQTIALLNGKGLWVIQIILGLSFLWLHIFQFSDQHHRIHELFKNLSGFYIAFCCVEGCVYIKQKIDPLYIENIEDQSRNGKEKKKVFSIAPQLCLIMTTIFTAIFFAILLYSIYVLKQIPWLQNTKIITIHLLSFLVIYGLAVYRHISLSLPAIMSCFCVYAPVCIKIFLYNYEWKEMQYINLPFHVLPIIFISFEGMYKHINQQVVATRERNKNMDKQYVDQNVKINRIMINSMYWAALGYFLYSLLHGSTVEIQYMVITAYIVLMIKGSIK